MRIMTLAAVAAVLLATPAYAEQIRVSTVGKSSEQVTNEIRRAAIKLCRAEQQGSQLSNQLETICVDHSFREAMAQYDSQKVIKSAQR